jgi:hypothetical protein
MDPNTALDNIRAAIIVAQAAADGDSNDAEIEAWQEVGEAFQALDEWISKGGFLPDEWKAASY